MWITRDGEVIVFHDETLGRIFPNEHEEKIESLALAEIKELNFWPENEVPTLQEVIDLCKGKIDLQIELKGKGTPKPVNDLIVKNGIENHVLVTSFDIELLREMKKINPRIKMGLLFENTPDLLWDMVTRIHLNYICPKANIVTKKMIGYAHALGFKVYAYHTNLYAQGENLIQWGVDDIGTDFPKLFLPPNEQKLEKYEREYSETFRTF